VEKVKNHFDEEAKEFDDLILRLIPGYREMLSSLVASIPFENSKPIKVLDLGCGTGNVSLEVKKRYPDSKIICIDLAENMIDIARFKLSDYHDIDYHVVDLRDFDFDQDYDLVISSLVLHHLTSDEEKIAVYRRIYDSLKVGGVFYNADTVLASSEYLEQVNMEQWKEFMLKTTSENEIKEKWLPRYYDEDHPSPLLDHVDWLREIGFKEVDVPWKYVKGAVFGGIK